MSNIDLQQLQQRLTPQLWELLTRAAAAATDRGWHLYLVGGAVRDLLLSTADPSNLALQDLDLAVDGLDRIVDAGAGVALATAIQQFYPAARLDIHGTFKTAALQWQQDPVFDSLSIDLATARTESYPYPAANPIVTASSIRQDLFRRDFTVNAMALRLTTAESEPDSLLDLFGGLADLHRQQMRVLHPASFIDDPTRIFRGARLAVRLGFHFEPETASYFRAAVASGVYERTAREHRKTPALQTRLRTELKYLLQVSYWQPTLALLANLDALQCIHPRLTLTPELLYQLRLLDRCLRRFDRQRQFDWQLRLELILAQLSPEERQQVAAHLQLPGDSIARLTELATAESWRSASLTPLARPSQVVDLLRQFDRSLLILVGIRCRDRLLRRQIWKYLTVWSQVQPPLTGDDLRRLGYKPGPQYRQILAALTSATVDGKIDSQAAAEAFIERYCHPDARLLQPVRDSKRPRTK